MNKRDNSYWAAPTVLAKLKAGVRDWVKFVVMVCAMIAILIIGVFVFWPFQMSQLHYPSEVQAAVHTLTINLTVAWGSSFAFVFIMSSTAVCIWALLMREVLAISGLLLGYLFRIPKEIDEEFTNIIRPKIKNVWKLFWIALLSSAVLLMILFIVEASIGYLGGWMVIAGMGIAYLVFHLTWFIQSREARRANISRSMLAKIQRSQQVELLMVIVLVGIAILLLLHMAQVSFNLVYPWFNSHSLHALSAFANDPTVTPLLKHPIEVTRIPEVPHELVDPSIFSGAINLFLIMVVVIFLTGVMLPSLMIRRLSIRIIIVFTITTAAFCGLSLLLTTMTNLVINWVGGGVVMGIIAAIATFITVRLVEQVATKRICDKCGAQIDSDSTFCKDCGTRVLNDIEKMES